MAKFNHIDVRGTKKVPSAFGNVFICSGAIGDAKTVTFPDGYLNGATPEPNLAFKAVFANGHNAANASSYLSLNGIVVVSNQNGVLAPIPIHAMTEGGSTVYKVLDANTALELYYTENYDGNSHPAFVVVGNPVVLSSSDYTIYANGQIGNEQVATVRSILSNNVPYGWLLCDATVRNKTDYPKLWGAIPSEFKNTTDNTFVIDLRETTLKGVGLTSKATIHYDSTGLTLGKFIGDRIQQHKHTDSGHTHSVKLLNPGVNAGGQFTVLATGGEDSTVTTKTGKAVLDNAVRLNNTLSTVRSGETTEVKAVGVNWIIKAM